MKVHKDGNEDEEGQKKEHFFKKNVVIDGSQ